MFTQRRRDLPMVQPCSANKFWQFLWIHIMDTYYGYQPYTVDGCGILHHQKDGCNPINNGINMNKPSTGAGFRWPIHHSFRSSRQCKMPLPTRQSEGRSVRWIPCSASSTYSGALPNSRRRLRKRMVFGTRKWWWNTGKNDGFSYSNGYSGICMVVMDSNG